MSPQGLLAQLKRHGLVVRVPGERLRVEGPRGVITDDLRHRLVENKPELIAALLGAAGWPLESQKTVRRFHRPEARLYPFLGRRVATPQGRGWGRLLGIFADRVIVRQGGRRFVFLPSEVRPPGTPAATLTEPRIH